MADISKITTLDGTTYNLKSYLTTGVPVATVDSTSTSTAFTVQVPEFLNETVLRDGLFFYIHNNVIASEEGCTLKVNTFDAKPMYNVSKTRITTSFAKDRLFPAWYSTTLIENGCWIIGFLTDTNTTYTTFSNIIHGTPGGLLADSNVYRYQLLFQMAGNKSGYVTPLNNNNASTSTGKTMLTNVEFDPFGAIYYYNSKTDIAAGERVPGGNSLFMAGSIDLRYTFNCGKTLTAFEPVYLKLSLQQNGSVKIADANPLVQALPSTADGYYYMFLGRTLSTYQFAIYAEHPIYFYNGTEIKQYINPNIDLGTVNASTVNGHTVASDVPSGAVFTDTKNTAGSTDSSSKLYLIGATSQAANPQTYSQDTAYVDVDGCLYSGGTKVLTGAFPITVTQGGTGNTSVDTTPTASSTKMCTSGGIKTELDKKVNLAGDNTLTGNLYLSADSPRTLFIYNNNLTMGTAPSENTYSGHVYFRDGAGVTMGYLEHLYTSGRSSQTKLTARNTGSGEAVNNQLTLAVSNAGVRSVSVSDAAPWRTALELDPTEVSVTIPTTMPSGVNSIGYAHAMQAGAVVYVEVYIVRNTTEVSSWTTLVSGLPVPKIIDSTPVYGYFMDANAKMVRPLFVRITETGVMQFTYGHATTGNTATYRFTMTYFTES